MEQELALQNLQTEIYRLVTETTVGVFDVIHHAYKQIKACQEAGLSDERINEAVRLALIQGMTVLVRD